MQIYSFCMAYTSKLLVKTAYMFLFIEVLSLVLNTVDQHFCLIILILQSSECLFYQKNSRLSKGYLQSKKYVTPHLAEPHMRSIFRNRRHATEAYFFDSQSGY